jgi:PAS domain S-box-containing protein
VERLSRDDLLTDDFFELSPDAMVVVGFDGYVKRANMACLALTGLTEEELRSRPYVGLIHPDDMESVMERASELASTGQMTVDYEVRVMHVDGTARWVRWSAKSVHERQLIFAVGNDFTKRRETEHQLREQTERYESLLQALSDLGEGFLITDGQRFLYANDAYLRISGYTRDEVLGFEDVWIPTPAEDRAALAERVRKRLGGGAVEDHYEARLVHKQGHYVDVEVSVKLIHTDEGPRIISIIRDITEQKRMEMFRDKFIADAAHEMRTPIATLAGMTEVLVNDWRDMSTEELERSMSVLRRQGERLSALVTNMLDLTRLQQGRLHVELTATALQPVVDRVIQGLSTPPGKRVVSRVEDIAVLADPNRLDQILTNLVTNAFRYGGNEIVIVAEAQNDHVEVGVVDDGAGVPEGLLPHLFDPFTRGPNSTGTGGAGLGLAIVKELVTAQEGEIHYERSQDGGARFCVRLRRA